MSFCFSNDLSVLETPQQEVVRKTFLSQAREGKDGSRIIDEQMEIIVCQG
jgi:hypothetical protein